jgi:DNA modification methylase
MYLHCDWHAGHHLKVLMDKIFGENALVNEIIWKRTSAHTGEGKVRSLGAAAGIRHGDSGKPWHGIDPNSKGNHWKFRVQKLDELEKEGHIYFPKKVGGVPRYKRYLDEMEGQLLQDVWDDILPLQAHSKERLGYPTQKPEALIERIMGASSSPMDIVLDPFCGCGTTLAVANKLGRRFIGIDVSPTACKLMGKRLRTLHAKYEIIGLPRTVAELKVLQPFEFQNWVFEKLHGRVNPRKTSDMGI